MLSQIVGGDDCTNNVLNKNKSVAQKVSHNLYTWNNTRPIFVLGSRKVVSTFQWCALFIRFYILKKFVQVYANMLNRKD